MALNNKVVKKNKSKKKIIVISLIAIVFVIFFGFKLFGNKESTSTKYTLTAATIGNVSSYLSTTGQVVVSDEYDVRPLTNSTITKVYKKKGDTLKKGDAIFQLDTTDLVKQLRTAQLSLAKAQNDYDKAIAPISDLSLAQAQNSLQNAKDNLAKLKTSQATALSTAQTNVINATTNLENTYNTVLNNFDNAFNGFSTIMNDSRKILYLTDTILPQDITGNSTTDKNLIDMNNIYDVEIPKYWTDVLNSTTFDSSSDKTTLENLLKRATAYYKNAKIVYDENVITYRNLSKNSTNEEIKSFLDGAIDTAQAISDAMRSLNNAYDYYIDYNNQRHRTLYAAITSNNSILNTDTNSALNYLSTLTTSKTNIISSEKNLTDSEISLTTLQQTQPMDLVSAQNNLKIQEESYKEAVSGITDIERKTYELAISQAQANVSDIQSSITACTIKSPFDGSIAKMNSSVGDDVTTSTSMATIISTNSIAQLTFNEVDVAKIKFGQKATLTFDAIEDLSLTGTVSDVDTMGTLNSGVVSYTVKIAFDTEDERVKPGMSVTANIIITSKNNVVLVPNSAIKTANGSVYVEEFTNNSKAIDGATIESSTAPVKVEVTTGLSDDTNTEILSGINTGDVVISKTTKTTKSSSTSGSSLFQFGRAGNSNTKSSSSSSSTKSSSSNNNSMPSGGDMGGGMPPVGF